MRNSSTMCLEKSKNSFMSEEDEWISCCCSLTMRFYSMEFSPTYIFLFLLVEVKSIFSWNLHFCSVKWRSLCLLTTKFVSVRHSLEVPDKTLKCALGEFIYLSKCDDATKFFFPMSTNKWQRWFCRFFILTCSRWMFHLRGFTSLKRNLLSVEKRV